MSIKRLMPPALLAGQFVLGCAGADQGSEAATEPLEVGSVGEALTFSTLGAWSGVGGVNGFSQIEFTDTLVDRAVFPLAPANSKHFVARANEEDVFGYYIEGASQITLGRIGAVTSNAAQYVCSTPGCTAPAVYDAVRDSCTNTLTLHNVNTGDHSLLERRGQLRVDSSRRAAIVVPANPSRVEEFSAYELQRHLQLVHGTSDVPVFTEASLLNSVRLNRTLFYVGKTQFAHFAGLRESQLPDEGYLIHTVGDAVVLLGKESGPAVAPGSVTWASTPNTKALQFRDSSTELRYDIPAGESLFGHAPASNPGGTIELFLRDESTCTQPAACGASHLFLLSHGQTAARLGMVAYNLAGGATALGVSMTKADGSVATVPDMPQAYIPRDANVHHVTVSFQPCAAPAGEICVSGWIDNRTVWTNVPVPGTDASSLNLSKTWEQRLTVNRPGPPSWNGSIHGLRFAKRPSTLTEHQTRTLASLQTREATDSFVVDFEELSGFPKEKVAPGRGVSGLLPSRWGQRGTLHAVYELLEQKFGVRWYMPSNLGLAYTPKTSTLIDPQKQTNTLPLRYRFTNDPLYLTPLHHVTADGLGEAFDADARNLWALRMRMGGEETAYNHAFYGFAGNQIGAHPDWFSPHGDQPCLGNQQLSNLVSAYAQTYAQSTSDAAYLASGSNAARDMRHVKNGAFSLSPLDVKVLPRNQDGSFVQTDCNVQDAQARGLLTSGYPGSQFFTGSASNYVFDFYNRMASGLDGITQAPGRNAHITGLAYMDYAFPPSIPIHPNVKPVVTFDVRDWGSVNPQATGQAQLTAWSSKMGAAGYYGWTYLIDSIYGLYTPPAFDHGAIAAATDEAMDLGIRGLTFEHSYTWDARSPVRDLTDPVLAPIIEDFRNFRTTSGYAMLWDEWPLSLSKLYGYGPGHPAIFNCKWRPGENPAESYEPSYSPYCARFNQAVPGNADIFARMEPLLRASTEARGMAAAQLNTYLLLRRMSDANFDANAAIDEYFDLYYGGASAHLRSFHNLISAIPAAHEVTACDNQPNSYEKHKCVYRERMPYALLTQLDAHVSAARTLANNGALSEVHRKRVKAFDRNVWCQIARAYYVYYPEGVAARGSDPLKQSLACVEDPTLETYTTTEMRFVVE